MAWGLSAAALLVVLSWYLWRGRSRRPPEPGFRYVWVNLDGTARELSPGERDYVTADYAPGDGARPAILHTYLSNDGWGLRGGFLDRRKLPRDVVVQPVHPDYDARRAELERTLTPMEESRRSGDVVAETGPGEFTTGPDPSMSRDERWQRSREARRETMRRYERLAAPERPPTTPSGT